MAKQILGVAFVAAFGLSLAACGAMNPMNWGKPTDKSELVAPVSRAA